MKSLVCGQTETFALEVPEPKIDAVLKIHGYKDMEKVRRAIRAAAQIAIQVFIENTTPIVSYRVVDIQSIDGSVLALSGDIYLKSPIFMQYLSNSRQAVVFALTVGKEIDKRTIEWMEQEKLVEALFLESAAWLGVENATKQFVLIVRNWALQHKLRISRRLGPGYSYPINGKQVEWELHDQKPLFQLLADDANLPVSLLESSAMLPKMSRSGLFGLIPQ